jgi:shikimate dehydrogenase
MTHLTGLIGYPVSHSKSPLIHAYWVVQHKLDTDYKLFTTAPARLRQTILHMRKKNVVGVNITVPHKQNVIQYLDSIDDTAKRIGAVNTVINQQGKYRCLRVYHQPEREAGRPYALP